MKMKGVLGFLTSSNVFIFVLSYKAYKIQGFLTFFRDYYMDFYSKREKNSLKTWDLLLVGLSFFVIVFLLFLGALVLKDPYKVSSSY